MKTKNIFIIILLIALTAGAGWLVMKRPSPGHREHQAHKDIYYCPMHPQYTSDRPGTCPICGMNLVKKEIPASLSEEHSHGNPQSSTASTESIPGYAVVSIDSQKQQLMGVKTAPVTQQMLTKTIHAYGYVAHDLELYEAQLEYIYAWQQFYSFAVRRPIKDEFRQDWWQYYAKSAAQNRWHTNDELKAQERLVKAEYDLIHMGLTLVDLKQLRDIKYGQPWVQPELLFFEKDQPFWIYAQVLENDLGFIAPAQKVIVTIPAYKETVEGVVRSIAPFVDPATRTSRVRIEVPNYKGELSVNLFVNVDIPVDLNMSLVVPRGAIMDTGVRKIIFVQTQDGVFEPRDIQTGFEGDGLVAVKSGVKEGEIIAVAGNFLLDSESRLQAPISGGGHQHD